MKKYLYIVLGNVTSSVGIFIIRNFKIGNFICKTLFFRELRRIRHSQSQLKMNTMKCEMAKKKLLMQTEMIAYLCTEFIIFLWIHQFLFPSFSLNLDMFGFYLSSKMKMWCDLTLWSWFFDIFHSPFDQSTTVVRFNFWTTKKKWIINVSRTHFVILQH